MIQEWPPWMKRSTAICFCYHFQLTILIWFNFVFSCCQSFWTLRTLWTVILEGDTMKEPPSSLIPLQLPEFVLSHHLSYGPISQVMSQIIKNPWVHHWPSGPSGQPPACPGLFPVVGVGNLGQPRNIVPSPRLNRQGLATLCTGHLDSRMVGAYGANMDQHGGTKVGRPDLDVLWCSMTFCYHQVECDRGLDFLMHSLTGEMRCLSLHHCGFVCAPDIPGLWCCSWLQNILYNPSPSAWWKVLESTSFKKVVRENKDLFCSKRRGVTTSPTPRKYFS